MSNTSMSYLRGPRFRTSLSVRPSRFKFCMVFFNLPRQKPQTATSYIFITLPKVFNSHSMIQCFIISHFGSSHQQSQHVPEGQGAI
jgi:hypothetical protein